MASSIDIDIGPPDYALRTLLQDALGLTAHVNTNIHPGDQMYTYVASVRGSEAIARSEYLASGSQLLAILEQLVRWKFGSFGTLPTILDFASGYGRLTRFLVQKLSPDHIWVSDIQADAVAFQQVQFGVHGFVSTADPDALACDQTFDCIFVASLFSHLPQVTFTRWLRKLNSLLKPGGLLIFTVHDESRLSPGNTMPDSGIWYAETSEVSSLDTGSYGVSFVTETFVRDAILAATGRSMYHRIPGGLLFHQDIYLIVNEPSPDFSDLHFTYLPHGAVDFALWTASGELRLRGWAADTTGDGTPVEVQIFVDGQLRQKCIPSGYRPDLLADFKDSRFSNAGWECYCQLPGDDPARLVLVKSVSATGTESLLYVGTISSLLPVGRVDLCLWITPEELYLKGWVAPIETSGSPLEVHLLVNGELQQKCLPSTPRPDLREHFNDDRFLHTGWTCSCHVPNSDSTQLLTVKGVSPTRAEVILYTGTIDLLLPLTALDPVVTASEPDERSQLKVELDHRLEYIRHLEAEVARKDAALADLETRLRRPPWRHRSPRA